MVKKKIPLHLFVVLSKIALVDIIVPYLKVVNKKRHTGGLNSIRIKWFNRCMTTTAKNG